MPDVAFKSPPSFEAPARLVRQPDRQGQAVVSQAREHLPQFALCFCASVQGPVRHKRGRLDAVLGLQDGLKLLAESALPSSLAASLNLGCKRGSYKHATCKVVVS